MRNGPVALAAILWQEKDPAPEPPATLWRQVLDRLPADRLQTIAVVNSSDPELQKQLATEGITLVKQPGPATGRLTPWRLGFQALNMKATVVLVYPLGPQPVRQETLQALLEAHAGAPEAIIIPTFSGCRGWPRLYPRDLVAEILLGVSFDELVDRQPDRVKLIAVKDPAVCPAP